jgi:hypothetical protein
MSVEFCAVTSKGKRVRFGGNMEKIRRKGKYKKSIAACSQILFAELRRAQITDKKRVLSSEARRVFCQIKLNSYF